MFERFDKEVRSVLAGATLDASAAGSTTIEPEHLLVGLASAPASEAGAILRSHNVTRTSLLHAIRGPSGGFTPSDADALARLGIDLAAVERAADETFGPGAFAQAGVRPTRGGARFGETAKAVLPLALHEALAVESKTITTVHLLLALVRDPRSRCAALLAPAGLDYDSVKAEARKAA